MFFKVNVHAQQRTMVLDLLQIFRAHVGDVVKESIIVEVKGNLKNIVAL
jgi:acetolactate synthase small subunit